MKNILILLFAFLFGTAIGQTNLKFDWERVEGIPGEILAITQNDGVLYAYSGTSIYKSDNLGVTWQLVETGMYPWHRSIVASTSNHVFSKQKTSYDHHYVNGLNGFSTENRRLKIAKYTASESTHLFEESAYIENRSKTSFDKNIFEKLCVANDKLAFLNYKSTKETYYNHVTNISSYFYWGEASYPLIVEHYYPNGTGYTHPQLSAVQNISSYIDGYFLSVKDDQVLFFRDSDLVLIKSIDIPFDAQDKLTLNVIDSTMYFATRKNEIYFSEDQGLNWDKKEFTFPILQYTVKEQIHFLKNETDIYLGKDLNDLSKFPENLATPLNFFVIDDIIFATCKYPHILYRSTDAGKTWSELNITGIIADKISKQVVFNNQNFVISNDIVYKQMSNSDFEFDPDFQFLAELGDNYVIIQNTIFRADLFKIEKYDFDNKAWLTIRDGSYKLYRNEKDSTQLIITGYKQLATSNDLGDSWTDINFDANFVNDLIAVKDTFLYRSDDYIYASVNNGATWELLEESNNKFTDNSNKAQIKYVNNHFYIVDRSIKKYKDLSKAPIILSLNGVVGNARIYNIANKYVGISFDLSSRFFLIDVDDHFYFLKNTPTIFDFNLRIETKEYQSAIVSRINSLVRNHNEEHSYFIFSQLNGLWKTKIVKCETTFAGAACDDNNIETEDDKITEDCICAGTYNPEQCRTSDSLLLANIYHALDGENWKNKTNWLTHTRFEKWYGVKTNGNGCVIAIDLSDNNLTGAIPSDIMDFQHLETIDLSSNNLFGCFDEHFLDNCDKNINFTDNPKLPYFGNFNQYCQKQVQIGAPCEDGDFLNKNDSITENCDCKGEIDSCRLEGYTVLESLYESTHGEQWSYNHNWLSTKPLNSWAGITTNSDGCVTEISINNYNLSGTLPDNIGDLKQLTKLKISRNKIEGEIPNSIYSLKHLRTLNLEENRLTGEISKDIEKLEDLRKLTLVGNQLGGTIPSEIGNLQNLVSLNLRNNLLTGNIPNQLSQLTKLEMLDLSVNQLVGELPSDLGDLPQITRLDLSNNDLTGTLPVAYSGIENLDLSGNNFSGCIPDTFKIYCNNNANKLYLANNPKLPWSGNVNSFCYQDDQIGVRCNDRNPDTVNDHIDENCNCVGTPVSDSCFEKDSMILVDLFHDLDGPNWHYNYNWLSTKPLNTWYGISTTSKGCVTKIELHNNNLKGNFPKSVTKLKYLTELWLYNNIINEELPKDMGNLKYLKYLYLSNNNISGSIPSSMGDLSKLKVLFISENKLTGEIPASLGNLMAIERIALNKNKLSGEIPSSFENLNHIKGFYVENNQLSGKLPDWIGNLDNLRGVYLSNNDFDGCFPDSYKNLCNLEHAEFYNNPKLSWFGDFTKFCADSIQIGAPCNDGIDDNILDKITSDCKCQGEEKIETCRQEDSTNLAIIYNELDGEHWDKNTNWLTSKPFDKWYGLSTNDQGCIDMILLNSNKLRGDIPKVFANFPYLKKLDLQSNSLSGCFPSELSNICNQLDIKFYGNHQLPWYGNFKNFCEGKPQIGVICNDNNEHTINDKISSDCTCKGEPKVEECRRADTSALRIIYKSLGGKNWKNQENWFSNKPLYEWYGIESLSTNGCISSIDLSDNNLQGIIPNQISEIKELKFLNLSKNRIFGQLPPKFENLKLRKLNLSNNLISGGVPNFVDIPLEELMLNNNNFEGCIPSGYNKFCGLIPIDFNNNLKLPYFGDFDKICNGNVQIGAPCDDGNSDTDIDMILNSCECEGTMVSSQDLKFLNYIQILPNPNRGNFILNIEFERPTDCEINLYSPLGKVVYRSHYTDKHIQKPIDVTHLPSGIYFLKVSTGDGFVVRRMVLE